MYPLSTQDMRSPLSILSPTTTISFPSGPAADVQLPFPSTCRQVMVRPSAIAKVEARHKSAKAPPNVFPTVRTIVCFSLFSRGCSGTAWDSCSTAKKRIQPCPQRWMRVFAHPVLPDFHRTGLHVRDVVQHPIWPHVQVRHAYAVHALVAPGGLCRGCRCRLRGSSSKTHGRQTQQRKRAQDHTQRLHRDFSFLCVQHGARATSTAAWNGPLWTVHRPRSFPALCLPQERESHLADPERPR